MIDLKPAAAPAPPAMSPWSTVVLLLIGAVAGTALGLGIWAVYKVNLLSADPSAPAPVTTASGWTTSVTLAPVTIGATGVVRVVVSAQGSARIISIDGPVSITNTGPIGLPPGTFATADLPWVNTDANPVGTYVCTLTGNNSPLSSLEWMFVFLDGSALFYTGAAAQFTGPDTFHLCAASSQSFRSPPSRYWWPTPTFATQRTPGSWAKRGRSIAASPGRHRRPSLAALPSPRGRSPRRACPRARLSSGGRARHSALIGLRRVANRI